MNVDNIPKELIAKIQKLIKLENSAKDIGNIEEAANAAGKIRDILMKYNLDIYQVHAAGDQTTKETPITDIDYNPGSLTKPHEGDWVTLMVKAIAPYYLCKAMNIAKSKDICIIGTPTNVEIVWYTVEQLTTRIRPISRDAFKNYKGREKRNTYFRGFFRGAVEGIQYQLAENSKREAWKAEQASKSKSVGNILSDIENTSIVFIGMQVTAQRKVSEYIKNSMSTGTSRGGEAPSLSGQSGKATGFETGKNINIASGVGSGASIPKSKWLN